MLLLAELLHNAFVHPAMAATRVAVLAAESALALARAADELALLAHDVTATWAFPAEPRAKPSP
jgi:hypothetical protein